MPLARRDMLKAGFAAPFIAGLAVVPPVFADADRDDNDNDNDDHPAPPLVTLTNEMLSGPLASAGTTYTDGAGNIYIEGAVYTGSASGTISGNFRTDLNIYTPAGSSTSRFWGSIVISDGATPSSVIFGEVQGMQTPASSGFTDQGNFEIDGGLGAYLHDHTHGVLAGSSSAALNTSGSTISWTLTSTRGPKPPQPPGLAFGLRFHNGHDH